MGRESERAKFKAAKEKCKELEGTEEYQACMKQELVPKTKSAIISPPKPRSAPRGAKQT